MTNAANLFAQYFTAATNKHVAAERLSVDNSLLSTSLITSNKGNVAVRLYNGSQTDGFVPSTTATTVILE